MSKDFSRNKALAKYLNSLPAPIRIAKSRDIREFTGVSASVLSFWRQNRTILDRVYFDKISEVVGVDLNLYMEND